MTDINCFEWYETLEKENLLLSFKGDFSHELVRAILILTENNSSGDSGSLQSKVFGVIVECLQNIYKHGADMPANSGLIPGIFLIGVKENNYYIQVGNMILNHEVDGLKQKIDRLNNMNEQELRNLQQEILKTTTLSEEGNAGIGLIYSKRKAQGNLEYTFKPIDERVTFFGLNINIPLNND